MIILAGPSLSIRPKALVQIGRRWLATSSSSAPFQVFNSDIKRHQRNRAVLHDPGTSRRTDYLRDEVATRLMERFMVPFLTISLMRVDKSTVQYSRGLRFRCRTSS